MIGLRHNGGMNAMVWTVGGLCKAVADVLSTRFELVRVQGEISGFTQASSGHCYFSLKDAQGQLRCAMFRRAASMLARMPRNGDQVEITARLGVYESRGDLQLVVEALRPLGQGALYEEFLRLKAKLQAEGLFDPEQKRPIPRSPRAIGLITSLGAAALHDVATALQRRVPHIPVVLVPAQVQGAAAPASLAQALQRLSQHEAIDVILMVRGGGSIEDLWAFNDEALVRLIRQCPVPVICGVGHETDFTLCDFAADLRAPTPTAAAELCALALHEWWGVLHAQAQRAQEAMTRRLEAQAQHLDRLQQAMGRPQSGVTQQSRHLARLALRVSRAVASVPEQAHRELLGHAQRLSQARQRWALLQKHRLQTAHAQLQAMNPRGVLERGYSWIQDAQGRALTRTEQFQAGMAVQAVLADGEVHMTVDAPKAQG
jgi:exodeoxyribonuclease VII large subunit